MLLDMVRILVHDHEGTFVGEVKPEQVIDAKCSDEVNGERTLTLTSTQELDKTDRVIVRDGMGVWHEYVVTEVESKHTDGGVVAHEHYCVWSLMYDLSATFVNDQFGAGVNPGAESTPVAAIVGLRCALEGTERWVPGTVSVTTMSSASFYRRSGWEGIKTLLENWGGELDATITVEGTAVTRRAVDLLNHIGTATPTRRFDYGADVRGIRRNVDKAVWPCRIVPLGKSEETSAGGYSRRPSIESVNGGIPWIQDDDAVPLTRVPDGSGGWEYPTLIVKNDAYSDPAQLKAWAVAHVKDYTKPIVSYEVDVAQLVRAGMNPHGVALGDEVIVVDDTFGDGGIRVQARVTKVEQSLLDATKTTLTVGSVTETLGRQMRDLAQQLGSLDGKVETAWSYQTTNTYLDALLGRVNDLVNATGGYTYITEGQGIRTYDVPVDDPTSGLEANQVVEIKGGTIRIANSKTSGGDWDWKTVLQSGFIAADVITANNITTGTIGNASGGSYWDLDNNILVIASGATMGGSTVGDVLNDVSQASSDATQAIGDAAAASSAASQASSAASAASTAASQASADAAAASAAASDAAKVATNYLAYSASTGLDVGYSGTNARTSITGSGVEVFDGNGDSALAATVSGGTSTVRVGKASGSGNIVMSSDGSVDVNSSTNTLAHFGYGQTTDPFGSQTTAPYYDLGVRDVGSDIGMYSLVEGQSNTARGARSHAEGFNTTAYGHSSHAEGSGTTAWCNNSHAEGDGTQAGAQGHTSSTQVHAEHAEGSATKATGVASHAEGMYSEASGDYSHAGGYNTIAADTAQTAIGQYNTSSTASTLNSRRLFVVGCGNTNSRGDAFYVQGNGNAWLKGTLTQNSDRRLKEHHAYLGEDAADFVRSLRPALYTKDGERHVGFYAQDVADADPWDTVTVTTQHTDESLGFDPLTLDYSALIAPVVAYAQSLERRVDALESRLAALEGGTQ